MKTCFFTLVLFCSLCVSSQTTVKSIIHDGISRSYRLHLPPGYDTCSLHPLVFNLHGLGSNAQQQEIYSQFNNVADTANIIVVYADGVSNQWNVSGSSGADDVGFISALIDTVSKNYKVDLNRVYSCGMSMGGYMSYRLACDLSNRIVAIVSVTGLSAAFPCNPGRPVAVMQIHGTADGTVPYSGVANTIQAWVNRNGCPTTPVTTSMPDINTTDGSTVTKSYYGLCNSSTEVILYTVNNGEHTWPSAAINIGVTNRDINASHEVWTFVRKYNFNNVVTAPNCDSLPTNSPAVLSQENFRVYPNPFMKEFTLEIEFPFNRLSVSIVDINGREVLKMESITQSPVTISRGNLAKGIYSLVISENEMIVGKTRLLLN